MSTKVLVPFDDSEPAREALRTAFDLFPDGEFVAVTVLDASAFPSIPNAADESEASEEPAEPIEEAAEQLEAAEAIADERGVEIATRTSVGAPAQEIVDLAENGEFDHVVMGSHGRSGVARILLGSVAEVVVRHSPVPVTVVR